VSMPSLPARAFRPDSWSVSKRVKFVSPSAPARATAQPAAQMTINCTHQPHPSLSALTELGAIADSMPCRERGARTAAAAAPPGSWTARGACPCLQIPVCVRGSTGVRQQVGGGDAVRFTAACVSPGSAHAPPRNAASSFQGATAQCTAERAQQRVIW